MEKRCVFYVGENKILKYYFDKLQASRNQLRFEALTLGGEKIKVFFESCAVRTRICNWTSQNTLEHGF